MSKLFLGIDLGGTKVKMAVVDVKGNIIEHTSFENCFDSVPGDVVSEIVAKAKKFVNFKNLAGTGVGVAGDIDQENGIVRFSPNMSKWRNIKLKTLLKQSLPQPIVIDNDANAAAWGAYWLDARAEVKNLLCITLGTGVGAGIICNETLYRGATGTAGEIGHMPIDYNGPECNCGSRGCIERFVGAPYLSQNAREAVIAGKSSTMKTLVNGNLGDITPHTISKAAKLGDRAAIDIWRDAGEKLGITLAAVINFVNPEIIVLAGGVSKAGSLILKPIRDSVRRRAFKKPASACKIIISKYTQKLGVVGAAFLTR